MKLTASETGQWWLAVVVMAAASFVLNWAWEMVQMPAYVEMAGRTWSETAYRCTVATLGDVVITLAIYGLGVVASMRIWWGLTGQWNEVFAAALMGAACAIAIEWKAIGFAEWSYNEWMPIVPIVEVGLWPLLQLPILVPASMGAAALVKRLSRPFASSNRTPGQ